MCHRYSLVGFHRDSSSKGYSMFSWKNQKKMCVGFFFLGGGGGGGEGGGNFF